MFLILRYKVLLLQQTHTFCAEVLGVRRGELVFAVLSSVLCVLNCSPSVRPRRVANPPPRVFIDLE